ncbi:TauD/TfdA family dioxygenase [Sphingobium aquiterrae]|uniref:TauD/TfdA dioxygenase family protein n=1 Tax=Sphingobium aquiterrae TaxID=2038656 RepID=UPI003016B47C
MPITFTPLTNTLGAEVHGVNLHEPFDDETSAVLRKGFDEYNLLLIRGVDISAPEQSRYGEVFGRIEVRKGIATGAVAQEPGTQYISNTRADGILGDGELKFHQDHLFHEEPLRALMLYAMEIPDSGSQTKWRSGNAIYEALSADLRARAEAVKCLHVFDYDRKDYSVEVGFSNLSANAKTALQPLVWRSPATGKPAVWVVRFSTADFEGVSHGEGEALLDEIWQAAESVEEYVHEWKSGDLLIWNNLALQHARMPFNAEERRTLRRTPLL